MPLIQIRRNARVTNGTMKHLLSGLDVVAASVLSCEDGFVTPQDILVEVSDASAFDKNIKDVNIRVLAHDYLERHVRADWIQQTLSEYVQKNLPGGTSWYVWLVLGYTSYGSDTMS